MEQSYVKSLFNELWDEFQIKCMQIGGNKKIWDYMKQYNMEWKPINEKYTGRQARYYRRRLFAKAEGKEFTEE